MPRLTEANLALTFDEDWDVTKYDEWSFYQNRFKDFCGGNKGVDFLGFQPDDSTLWLIELKDYRGGRPRIKTIELWDEVAIKARDTLAGLFAAKVDRQHTDQAFAQRALGATKIRVVLHLEQTRRPSKLFPRVADRAAVQQKLKQLVKPIDAHPLVIEASAMSTVPWRAETI